MTANESVLSYKKLSVVENAFRSLKTVQREIRPIYHKRDDRMRAHVFLCMLAYYVQWHMQQHLKPFTERDKGKNRKWTFNTIIQTLKQITKNTMQISKGTFCKISRPTDEQARILNFLGVKI